MSGFASINAQESYLVIRMEEFVHNNVLPNPFITIEIMIMDDVFLVILCLYLDCTYPYFADQFSQSCTDVCQFGYFKNLAEHTCELCPSACISCEA